MVLKGLGGPGGLRIGRVGAGRVEWHRLTLEQNPTQFHIVNALADLPIDDRALDPARYDGRPDGQTYFLTRSGGEASDDNCALRRRYKPHPPFESSCLQFYAKRVVEVDAGQKLVKKLHVAKDQTVHWQL